MLEELWEILSSKTTGKRAYENMQNIRARLLIVIFRDWNKFLILKSTTVTKIKKKRTRVIFLNRRVYSSVFWIIFRSKRKKKYFELFSLIKTCSTRISFETKTSLCVHSFIRPCQDLKHPSFRLGPFKLCRVAQFKGDLALDNSLWSGAAFLHALYDSCCTRKRESEREGRWVYVPELINPHNRSDCTVSTLSRSKSGERASHFVLDSRSRNSITHFLHPLPANWTPRVHPLSPPSRPSLYILFVHPF